jgi:hypothetical protein
MSLARSSSFLDLIKINLLICAPGGEPFYELRTLVLGEFARLQAELDNPSTVYRADDLRAS